MAQLLGQVNPGTIVKLNENGQPVNYIVVQQGKPSSLYDDSCNGTWLLRQNIYANQRWNSSNNNTYATSTVNMTYLPSLLPMYDNDIQSVIQTVKIPYVNGTGSGGTVASGSDGLSTKLFLLSGYEVGWTTSTYYYFPVDGAVLSYFQNTATIDSKRIAYLNGDATRWWLRSPRTNNDSHVWIVNSDGNYNYWTASSSYGVRPAMVLPSTMLVESDGTITNPPALSIYTPSLAMQGQSLPIQWSPISNAISYQLQRNTGTTWETIYTGTDTSYTDTVGSWTTVQYQVAVDIGGGYGAYTQSASIPVIAASTLAISGQDGSLGTITADIPYTVTSDTGNPISIVRTVNGVQYASVTVESGFAYNIPVMELPTGDGTIVITASVQSTSGLVTVTRTWTYTKTPINFSNSGSVASLSVNGENILPITLAEAVRTSPVWGGSLDLALQKLSSATFYETITPTAELGTLTPGDIIYLNENGSPVEFYVASMDYEPDYNDGRVLVVRKEAAQQGVWNSSGVNTYDGSTIDTWLNSTYLPMLDSDVQTAIGATNIPYTPMGGTTTVQRISKAVFALSGTELGGEVYPGYSNAEGTILPISSALQVCLFNSLNIAQFTRSPYISTSTDVYVFSDDQNFTPVSATQGNTYYRPAFTLPTTFTAYTDTPTTGLYDIQNNLLLSLPGVNIETGSYTGTGTYGASNPNSLTFGFVPHFVVITSTRNDSTYPTQFGFLTKNGLIVSTTATDDGTSVSLGCSSVDAVGNTFSWYNTSNVNYQLNNSSHTYQYTAIG